jgi:general secretion pathway protein D
VGVKFKVKPHITKKQAITLDLTLEVNSVTSEAQVVGNQVIPPTLGRRDFKTKVTVNDGKTIVVGGLIRDEKSVTETKVPWLGDIPLLGWFFKHKSVSDTKTNLLVFITPYIVTRQIKIDSLTGQKREEQRRLKLRSR